LKIDQSESKNASGGHVFHQTRAKCRSIVGDLPLNIPAKFG